MCGKQSLLQKRFKYSGCLCFRIEFHLRLCYWRIYVYNLCSQQRPCNLFKTHSKTHMPQWESTMYFKVTMSWNPLQRSHPLKQTLDFKIKKRIVFICDSIASIYQYSPVVKYLLFSWVRKLIFSSPVITLLYSRVIPQCFNCTYVGLLKCHDLFYIHFPDQDCIGLKIEKQKPKQKNSQMN